LVFILSIGAAANTHQPKRRDPVQHITLKRQIVVFDRRFRRVLFFDDFTS
jgi:hypothetical protein